MEFPLKTSIIYSSSDRMFRDELELHLSPLVDLGFIDLWSDKDIAPGENWDNSITENIHSTNIFILLISIDFYNSIYIRKKELRISIDKHKDGNAILIPIITRDCCWESFPYLRNLQILPPGAVPISDVKMWGSRDKAWTVCVKKISEIVTKQKKEISTSLADNSSKNDKLLIDNDKNNNFLGFVKEKKDIIYGAIARTETDYEIYLEDNSDDSHKRKIAKKIESKRRLYEYYREEGYKRLDQIDLIVDQILKSEPSELNDSEIELLRGKIKFIAEKPWFQSYFNTAF